VNEKAGAKGAKRWLREPSASIYQFISTDESRQIMIRKGYTPHGNCE
jgi:hypothetical protein